MIKGKHQISLGELHEIRVLLVEGYSVPEIATKLSRSKSTLYRLFQKNGIEYKMNHSGLKENPLNMKEKLGQLIMISFQGRKMAST